MIEEEKFFAWLDGELGPDEAARVEAEVAADPELRRKAEQHRALAANLRGAFAAVSAAPVPDHVRDTAEGGNVVDLAQARETRQRRSAPLWAQAAALAATLAVGIFTGTLLSPRPSGPTGTEDGRIVARGELKHALFAQLASEPVGHGPRIGMTYRDKTGAFCRTFSEKDVSGLACRNGGEWQIRGLFQNAQGQGQSSEYRMAAGTDPRIMDMVDESMAGEPFDAAQERAALQRGWN